MAIQTSGQISIQDIINEFGGSGTISAYYRDGSLVPSNIAVPGDNAKLRITLPSIFWAGSDLTAATTYPLSGNSNISVSNPPWANTHTFNAAQLNVASFVGITKADTVQFNSSSSNAYRSLSNVNTNQLKVFMPATNVDSGSGWNLRKITNIDSDPASFNIDPDSGNTQTSSTVSAGISADDGAAQALTQIANAIAGLSGSFTWNGTVYSSGSITTVATLAEFVSRDTAGDVYNDYWDIRNQEENVYIAYTSNDEIAGMKLLVDNLDTADDNKVSANNYNAVELTCGGGTVTMSAHDLGNTGSGGAGHQVIQMGSLISSSGTLGTNNAMTVKLMNDSRSRYIEIDLGTSASMGSSGSITINDGAQGTLTLTDVASTSSTTAVNGSVPTSGEIELSDFYGAKKTL